MGKLRAFQECINFAKEELGAGLITSDIYSDEGLPVVDGYNSNPKATALFANITEHIKRAVKNEKYPQLGDYYVINLQANTLDLVIIASKFQWKLLVNTDKVKLGYLFSIFLPEAIDKFKKAASL